MNTILGVAGAGGFGGLLAALLTRVTGVGLFAKWSPAGDIFAEIAFGVAAALFGVFLLSASDPKNARTLVFAVACGLAWQPIVAGTSSYVKQYASTQAANSAKQADASLPTGGAAASSENIQAAASQTATAISKLPQVTDSSDRSTILNASQSVIQKVSASSTTSPSAKIEALHNIGLASLNSDSQSVGLQTVQPLKVLANSLDPAVRTQAESALQDLAVQAQRQNRSLVTAAIKLKAPVAVPQP